MEPVYLDNAATSWPKPPVVGRAMVDYLERCGGSAGRGSHQRAIEAGLEVYRTREAVAGLLGVAVPNRVVFGPNATWAVNQALCGLLRPGDRVVADVCSHNAVRRPLLALERRLGLEVVWWSPEDQRRPLDPQRLDELLAAKPTRLVTVCHISNVLGTVHSLERICAVARRRGALVLADCAQSAGAMPLELDAWGVDLTAFTGHKALCGPQGTGGLILGPDLELEPLMRGGGGDSRSPEMPPELPERLEAGTYNVVGLAGLRAGIDWLLERGPQEIYAHKRRLIARLLDGLLECGAEVLGPLSPELRGALAAFNLPGWEAQILGAALEETGGIQTRSGLHCAPGAHELAGTLERGAVRVGLGAFTTDDELDNLFTAVETLRRGKR